MGDYYVLLYDICNDEIMNVKVYRYAETHEISTTVIVSKEVHKFTTAHHPVDIKVIQVYPRGIQIFDLNPPDWSSKNGKLI